MRTAGPTTGMPQLPKSVTGAMYSRVDHLLKNTKPSYRHDYNLGKQKIIRLECKPFFDHARITRS
jgi:hypothetical protein